MKDEREDQIAVIRRQLKTPLLLQQRRHLGREPINSEWSADARFAAHYGLNSDIEELKQRFLVVQAVEAARTVEDHVITDMREADVGSILGFGFAPLRQTQSVCAREQSDEAIHLSAMPRYGLLRFARNDGKIVARFRCAPSGLRHRKKGRIINPALSH